MSDENDLRYQPFSARQYHWLADAFSKIHRKMGFVDSRQCATTIIEEFADALAEGNPRSFNRQQFIREVFEGRNTTRKSA